MKSSPLPCCVLPNFVSFHAALPPGIAFSFSAHSSPSSSSIFPGLLCRFRIISSGSLAALPPYCCLCTLCPIPLFPAAYLQDFSDNFRFIQSVSLAALPLLLPLRSLPNSSLSSSISSRLLCRFSLHSISFTGCFAPFVAFAFSTPFLSFQQHISRTSVDFRRFLSVYYLQNFSAAYPLFPGISISPPLLSQLRVFTSGTPVCFASRCCLCFMLLPLPSLPDSSLSNSISLCPFSLPAFLPDVAFRSSA